MPKSHNVKLVTAHECPDLCSTYLDEDMNWNPGHSFSLAWPAFMSESGSSVKYGPTLFKDPTLRRWQLNAVVEPTTGTEEVVALCCSVPFYWSTPEDPLSLPDGGWDQVLESAVERHLSDDPLRPEANALCILEMTVLAEFRNKSDGVDIVSMMFSWLKAAAVEAGLKVIAIPVRPTLKSRGPDVWMEMGRYCSLTRGRENEKQLSEEADGGFVPWPKGAEPYDPWIRKHLRLGGRLAKVCPTSYTVRATIVEWEEWTKVDFGVPSVDPRKQAAPDGGRRIDFYHVVVPGALVPVKVYPAENLGLYVEPDVWILHQVLPPTDLSKILNEFG